MPFVEETDRYMDVVDSFSRRWTNDGSRGCFGPGEGAKEYSARGSDMFFKAIGELDDGDFSLMERTLPPGGRRPPVHRHTNCSEAYFILEGTVTVVIDEGGVELGGPRRFRARAARHGAHLCQRQVTWTLGSS